MKSKIIYSLSMTVLSIAMLLLVYLSSMLFLPYTPAEFLNQPFPVEKDTIAQGEVLRYYIHYNKKMDVPVEVTQTLINHVQINFPQTSTRLPLGEYKVMNNDITIPSFITPGTAYLCVTFIYKVNPLREITITTRTEDFYIKEAE